MKHILYITCIALLGFAVSPADSATITAGDVTSNLNGTIFFDDARLGGGDATAQEGGSIVVNRFLDYDGNGTISAPGVAGLLEIESFGFATSGAVAANDATEVDITIIYFGQNENLGGGDDVTLGTQRVNYSHSGAGEYFVDFDTPFSAIIDGLGSRYRIQIEPIDVDGGLQESIRIKTRPAAEQTFGHQGPVLSLSGSFSPEVPEPTSIALISLLGSLCCLARRR